MNGQNRKNRFAARVTLCAALAFSLCAVYGCRDSDALKEIIIDQNSDIIDYDNPQKFYINDSGAEEESDQVSSLEVSEESPESDIIQHLIIYSSTPNTEGFSAKQSLFDPFPDFTGIEASDTVCFEKSDDPNAFDHAVTAQEQEEEPEEEEDLEEEQNPEEASEEYSEQVLESTTANITVESPETTTEKTTTPETSSTTATGASSTGGKEPLNDVPDETGGSSNGDESESISDTNDQTPPDENDIVPRGDGTGSYKDISPEMTPYTASDPFADVPAFETLAAYGNVAIAVQMVGGAGALASTDAATREKFDEYGITYTANIGWDAGCASYYDASSINVENIVMSGAEAILVESVETFTYYLSDEQFSYLETSGIKLIEVYDLITSVNIKKCVEVIGDALKESTTATYGSGTNGNETSVTRAAEYIDMHDEMVSSVNGGLAKGSELTDSTYYQDKVLQSGNDGDVVSINENSGSSTTFTVLVDYWDDDATLITKSGIEFASGCAYASLGYSSTPVSYYIQAGGTINTAAGWYDETESRKAPVLQLFTDYYDKSFWKNYPTQFEIVGSGRKPLLDSGSSYQGQQGFGKGLGTDIFPCLIVTTSEIKNSILSSSANEFGLYHAFGWVDTIDGQQGGFLGLNGLGGGSIVKTCIGYHIDGLSASEIQNGAPNPTYPSGVIDEEDILVNPSGICDWTTGSVESYLESGWVAESINGETTGYTYTQWEQAVTDFYSWAYGVDNVAIDANNHIYAR